MEKYRNSTRYICYKKNLENGNKQTNSWPNKNVFQFVGDICAIYLFIVHVTINY